MKSFNLTQFNHHPTLGDRGNNIWSKVTAMNKISKTETNYHFLYPSYCMIMISLAVVPSVCAYGREGGELDFQNFDIRCREELEFKRLNYVQCHFPSGESRYLGYRNECIMHEAYQYFRDTS